MQATLHVTKKLTVTPLFTLETPTFADIYSRGLWWAMHGDYEGEKPQPDSYFVDNLKRDASKDMFDGQHDNSLHHLGFYFGMLHGSILDPRSNKLRPDVTALMTFTHPNTKHGYSVARRDHFYYADITYVRTESALLKELSEIARDMISYSDDPDSWYYAIGCLVGGLSIPLFSETDRNGSSGKKNTARFASSSKALNNRDLTSESQVTHLLVVGQGEG